MVLDHSYRLSFSVMWCTIRKLSPNAKMRKIRHYWRNTTPITSHHIYDIFHSKISWFVLISTCESLKPFAHRECPGTVTSHFMSRMGANKCIFKRPLLLKYNCSKSKSYVSQYIALDHSNQFKLLILGFNSLNMETEVSEW
jgi:hypothetical protein